MMEEAEKLAIAYQLEEKRIEIQSLKSKVAFLAYELTEARAEISHHHTDFRRIDKAFEDFSGNDFDICRTIRGIVE